MIEPPDMAHSAFLLLAVAEVGHDGHFHLKDHVFERAPGDAAMLLPGHLHSLRKGTAQGAYDQVAGHDMIASG